MSNGPVSLAQVTSPWIKLVVFGQSGVGKTVFSCGSQYFRTFVFDVDDGTIAARMWQRTRKEFVDVWPIRTREDFTKAFDWFVKYHQHYQLAVVDTATELQKQVIREACARKKVEVPTQEVWGVALNVMEAIASGFHHLPLHVIWTCHEEEREDPELHRMMFKPSFQGAFKTAYAKHFSAIIRLTKQDIPLAAEAGQPSRYQTVRVLHCDGSQVTHAKNRGGALAEWELPDVDMVLGKMIQAAIGPVYQAAPTAQVAEVQQPALPPASI